jgi:DNA-binding NtrC family response regulator
VLAHLARAGVQLRGEPLGVDAAALALLLEHPWPGNDTELSDVLNRAAGVAVGPLVTSGDLQNVGFGRPGEAAPTRPTSLPPPSAAPDTRRRRSRPSRSPRQS